jgi:hydroxypyruvate isomerase
MKIFTYTAKLLRDKSFLLFLILKLFRKGECHLTYLQPNMFILDKLLLHLDLLDIERLNDICIPLHFYLYFQNNLMLIEYEEYNKFLLKLNYFHLQIVYYNIFDFYQVLKMDYFLSFPLFY